MTTSENCTQTPCPETPFEVPRRYEIWTMTFPENASIHGCRPVIIVGVDDEYSLVTVVPLTSKLCYRQKSSHILVEGRPLACTSRGLCELVTTLPYHCLVRRIGYLTEPFDRYALRHALSVHLGLDEYEDVHWTC